MAVQEKDTTLLQMKREKKSMNETIEHMKHQIQSYDAEKQSKEQLITDNAKLKQKIEDMEEQFHKIRDDFTTERTACDSLAAENVRLEEEIEAIKAELVAEKQSNIQLKEDNITLKEQIIQKNKKIRQPDDNMKSEMAVKEELLKEMVSNLQQ